MTPSDDVQDLTLSQLRVGFAAVPGRSQLGLPGPRPDVAQAVKPVVVGCGTSDSCVQHVPLSRTSRGEVAIGTVIVPLSWRHEPDFGFDFSGKQRRSKLSVVARDRRSACDGWR